MISSTSDNVRFIGDMPISGLLTGLWQVSGAHGLIQPEAAVLSMFEYAESGFNTWDVADHYGPAEEFIGEFRRQLLNAKEDELLSKLRVFTKWVPSSASISKDIVRQAVTRSLRRMGVERLDLLQFHWWDYDDNRYLQALDFLSDIKAGGRITNLGLTNFDTERLGQILSKGISVVSNQVQYSMIDRRPENQMALLCQSNGVHILAYGTVCGGLLTDRYLGSAEPRDFELNTASLKKYKQMIDAWGGWELFQELLLVARGIADKHSVSVANVAVRYILDRPAVAGVIVGARLGIVGHIEDNRRIGNFHLDCDDLENLETILKKSRNLMDTIGDCGDEYRI